MTTRGIFEPQEGFAPVNPAQSPFAVADDAPASPFAVVAEPDSPFASLKDDHPARLSPEAGRPARLPERRSEVPADAASPFSQDPAPFGGSPFEASSSPFAAAEPAPAASTSPFAVAAEPVAASGPSPAVSAAIAAAAATPTAASAAAAPAPAEPTPVPAAAPAQSSASPVQAAIEPEESDSRSIRQLELRAIFGVDRELGAEEILQRSRALPGIRHVARVPAQDAGAIDALRRLIPALGFPAGQVKLHCGGTPIEFIREGGVLLAVQNDGSYAPGVKETLMIVARELGRL